MRSRNEVKTTNKIGRAKVVTAMPNPRQRPAISTVPDSHVVWETTFVSALEAVGIGGG